MPSSVWKLREVFRGEDTPSVASLSVTPSKANEIVSWPRLLFWFWWRVLKNLCWQVNLIAYHIRKPSLQNIGLRMIQPVNRNRFFHDDRYMSRFDFFLQLSKSIWGENCKSLHDKWSHATAIHRTRGVYVRNILFSYSSEDVPVGTYLRTPTMGKSIRTSSSPISRKRLANSNGRLDRVDANSWPSLTRTSRVWTRCQIGICLSRIPPAIPLPICRLWLWPDNWAQKRPIGFVSPRTHLVLRASDIAAAVTLVCRSCLSELVRVDRGGRGRGGEGGGGWYGRRHLLAMGRTA